MLKNRLRGAGGIYRINIFCFFRVVVVVVVVVVVCLFLVAAAHFIIHRPTIYFSASLQNLL